MSRLDDPAVQKAIKTYEDFMRDPELREAYEARLKYNLDQNSLKRWAREEGLKEGRALGIEQGRIDALKKTAHNMLAAGLEPQVISQLTGLEIDQIEKLKVGY